MGEQKPSSRVFGSFSQMNSASKGVNSLAFHSTVSSACKERTFSARWLQEKSGVKTEGRFAVPESTQIRRTIDFT